MCCSHWPIYSWQIWPSNRSDKKFVGWHVGRQIGVNCYGLFYEPGSWRSTVGRRFLCQLIKIIIDPICGPTFAYIGRQIELTNRSDKKFCRSTQKNAGRHEQTHTDLSAEFANKSASFVAIFLSADNQPVWTAQYMYNITAYDSLIVLRESLMRRMFAMTSEPSIKAYIHICHVSQPRSKQVSWFACCWQNISLLLQNIVKIWQILTYLQ